MTLDWDKACDLVRRAGRVIILTHVNPDGDAIGALLGLGHLLRMSGKTVTLAVDGGVPASFAFLPGAQDVRAHLQGVEADLVIIADCSDERRIGEVGRAAKKLKLPIINIDHHPTNTMFGAVNLVDEHAVATAELILDWSDHLGLPLTADVAQCLLCGVVTDTLCFRTNNVTASTLGKAQRLMAAGGDLSGIVQRTINRVPAGVIRLWGQVMSTVRLEDNVIWLRISRAAREAAGYMENRDGGLTSLLLQADEAHIACVFKEEADSIDLSLRAVPGFDVSKIAVSLGGGGHVLAAGAVIPGTLDEVEARVIPLLKEAARAGTRVYA